MAHFVCAVAFIGWMLISFVWSFHTHEHAHVHTLDHGIELESDACHRALFHFEGKCEHHDHIVSVEQTCSFCTISIHPQSFVGPGLLALNSPVQYRILALFSQSAPVNSLHTYCKGRAPPFV